ncbi:MAG: cyclic nucleotide-binding domain-containing protein [Nitrospinae bacterium]|nr:cyclic nucleotide-binding domain-containing protein [Nitrospinota bacterium]
MSAWKRKPPPGLFNSPWKKINSNISLARSASTITVRISCSDQAPYSFTLSTVLKPLAECTFVESIFFLTWSISTIFNPAPLGKKQVMRFSFLFMENSAIFKNEDIGHSMYFISSGCVEVEMPPNPVRLGSGDFFGEIALIKKFPRTFSVKALGFCDLLVLSESDFNIFLDANPEIRVILTETADKRIEIDDLN